MRSSSKAIQPSDLRSLSSEQCFMARKRYTQCDHRSDTSNTAIANAMALADEKVPQTANNDCIRVWLLVSGIEIWIACEAH